MIRLSFRGLFDPRYRSAHGDRSWQKWPRRGRFVRLDLDYPVAPKVTKYECDLADTGWCGGGATSSLAEVDGKTKSSYYCYSAAKKPYLKYVSTDTDYEEIKVDPAP